MACDDDLAEGGEDRQNICQNSNETKQGLRLLIRLADVWAFEAPLRGINASNKQYDSVTVLVVGCALNFYSFGQTYPSRPHSPSFISGTEGSGQPRTARVIVTTANHKMFNVFRLVNPDGQLTVLDSCRVIDHDLYVATNRPQPKR